MEANVDEKDRQNSIFVTSLDRISQSDRLKFLDEVMRVENEAWPKEVQATRDKFESRSEVFPEGFFLAEVKEKGILGVSTSEVINLDLNKPPESWEEISDNGYIKTTHEKGGNALYVVSVGVSRKVEKLGIKGLGTALVNAQKDLTKRLGLKHLVLGARISRYGRYLNEHPDVPVEDYLNVKRDDGETFDPEIRFYERCGLKVVKIVPDYMENDPESRNYGAVMVWENTDSKGGE